LLTLRHTLVRLRSRPQRMLGLAALIKRALEIGRSRFAILGGLRPFAINHGAHLLKLEKAWRVAHSYAAVPVS
jgi:hypothetical protein